MIENKTAEFSLKGEKNENFWFCPCSINNVLNVISKKWAILIINTIGYHGKLRFNELLFNLKRIKPNPKTLTNRLRELEEEGLLVREKFSEIPPRVEYSLTRDGIELRNILKSLVDWADKRTKEIDS
ncbi:MAG: transcriptional regulator [Candidatus Lokiarchaeota archaeon]|nr:transcriptional regulator [Candidatus Lokiarchaeota archaeon]